MIRDGALQLKLGDYRTTLAKKSANLILTSPPYNIGSKSPAVTGFRKHGGFDPKSYRAIREYPDSLPEGEYQETQIAFLVWALDHLEPGGVIAYNHKPRRKKGRLIHPTQWTSRVPNLVLMEEVIWDRGSTHNHCKQMMWPHTERVYIFRREGDKYPLNNTKDLPHRSDLWKIPPEVQTGRMKHNAPFPLALADQIITAWSRPGDTVMDPYCGSGTTGVSALRLGRKFVGAERLAKYHSMALERLETCLYVM